MWSISRAKSLALTALLIGGCKDASTDEGGTSQFRAQIQIRNAGIRNSGVRNNGIRNAGVRNNGVRNATIRNATTRNGLRIEGAVIEGSMFKGTVNGTQISGMDFVGATLEFTALDPDPVTFTMRIDSAEISTTNPYGDVWFYNASFLNPKDQTWSSVCAHPDGTPDKMLPLSGMYWNETTWTRVDEPTAASLLCHGGVLSKCVDIGYRPWATAKDCDGGHSKKCKDVSLKDHHEACQRMLAADYCGDGKAWTLDGTLLDIFDYLEPPLLAREEKWTFEARWQPTGAMCLSKQRHPELGFTGKCKDSKGKERTLKACNPYEDDKGLTVSTFNGTGATGVKDKDKDKDK